VPVTGGLKVSVNGVLKVPVSVDARVPAGTERADTRNNFTGCKGFYLKAKSRIWP